MSHIHLKDRRLIFNYMNGYHRVFSQTHKKSYLPNQNKWTNKNGFDRGL